MALSPPCSSRHHNYRLGIYTTDLQYSACGFMHCFHVVAVSNKATNGWWDTSWIADEMQQFSGLIDKFTVSHLVFIHSFSAIKGATQGWTAHSSTQRIAWALVTIPNAKLSQPGLVPWSIIFSYLKTTEHECECCWIDYYAKPSFWIGIRSGNE